MTEFVRPLITIYVFHVAPQEIYLPTPDLGCRFNITAALEKKKASEPGRRLFPGNNPQWTTSHHKQNK